MSSKLTVIQGIGPAFVNGPEGNALLLFLAPVREAVLRAPDRLALPIDAEDVS